MANSPLVSIRIPAETLERLDDVAQKLYPSRRPGKNPNRSQVILDAIEEFLANHESEASQKLSLENQVNEILQQYKKALEEEINEYINQKFSAYAYNLENRLQKPRTMVNKTIH